MALDQKPNIDQAYREKFAKSAELSQRAKGTIAGGITHDARNFSPFPIYIDRAEGSRKWDVDGNELLDHWMGHGSMLLGHSHPAVTEAMAQQLSRGTHHGACHELEVEWAELVKSLIPSAEKVRFVMSGTEATMLAIRLVRAVTGKEKIIRFQGHFHGWHDYALVAYQPPFDIPSSAGIPACIPSTMLAARPNDIQSVKDLLDNNDDVAAIIIEPAGGSNGTVPTDRMFLAALRTLTKERNVPLIFDEVITGFRYAPGGAQEYYGITPDMTTLAKIVAGGQPGGAIVGRADLLAPLEFSGDPARDRRERVLHQGTFNANPVGAAAAVACLKLVATGEPQRIANRSGQMLREGLSDVLEKRGVPGVVVGECSVFQVLLGEGMAEAVATSDAATLIGARGPAAALRKAMLVEGVDLMRTGGFTSLSHSDDDIERVISAFDRAVQTI
jgi:glutamate-1-semialdehyde 2,1-aminomutase